MVEDWLVNAAAAYNRASHAEKDNYASILLLPSTHLATILDWAFQSLPDEILVGFDPALEYAAPDEVLSAFSGKAQKQELFAGQGYLVGQPHLVNRGDSFSVHHVPEEWVDEMFSADRGSRGARFTHWLHTHPNCVAIPSEADADAAQHTAGVDMILGIEFSPQGPLGWFEDAEGVRRRLQPDEIEQPPKRGRRGAWGNWRRRQQKPVLGTATTGHLIHGLELISFHRTGVGINVVLTDERGVPHGWPFD
jgi:proteasome lid subunit RPN8/RPN11